MEPNVLFYILCVSVSVLVIGLALYRRNDVTARVKAPGFSMSIRANDKRSSKRNNRRRAKRRPRGAAEA